MRRLARVLRQRYGLTREKAVRMAEEFPWIGTGCIEVRPVRDVAAVRVRVGA